MPWIKLHTEILDEPRFGRLPEGLKWRYVQLSLLAGECDREGYLAKGDCPMTAEEIAWRLRLPQEQLSADLEALRDAGLLHLEGTTCLLPDFAQRQGRRQEEKRQQWREQQRRKRRKVFSEESGMTQERSIRDVRLIDTEEEPDSESGQEVDKETHSEGEDVSLSEGQKAYQAVYPQALRAEQCRLLAALERRYGLEKLVDCIHWAGQSSIPAGRALRAIQTALKTWQVKAGKISSRPPQKSSAIEALRQEIIQESSHGRTS